MNKGKYGLHQLGWIGQRSLDCEVLNDYFDLSFVSCCDHSLETKNLFENSTALFSLEKVKNNRRIWTSSEIEEIIETFKKEMELHLHSSLKKLNVVPYSNSEYLESFFSKFSNVNLIAPQARVKHLVEDKLFLQKVYRETELPPLKRWVLQFKDIVWEDFKNELNTPFVIQKRHASSGLGTFFIFDKSDFDNLKHSFLQNEYVLLSEYIDNSYSINVNALVIGGETIIRQPSIQLVGFLECCDRSEIYCGNDFDAAQYLDSDILMKCRKYTQSVAQLLTKNGFEGIFGLDFIVDSKNELYLVDINARFQNSTYLLSIHDRNVGIPPMPIIYIAYTLGEIGRKNIHAYRKAVENTAAISISQLLFHKRTSGSILMPITQALLEQHLYEINEKRSLGFKSGTFFLSGFPTKNTSISSKSTVGKLIYFGSVLQKDKKLKTNIIELCQTINGIISL